eukprot:CAMPEP_0171771810 /NCGR_PEP_ID=MMETSP0991-20121206/54321_1 /TAXON_ID=483369 /ORGANISM="non described non described, Strain CCMP2098" /LENGTH=31 /DNA_ID= /DNA_START= /DNA_END= /DNA_ORIENTATION=
MSAAFLSARRFDCSTSSPARAARWDWAKVPA